jgi:plastocyanin
VIYSLEDNKNDVYPFSSTQAQIILHVAHDFYILSNNLIPNIKMVSLTLLVSSLAALASAATVNIQVSDNNAALTFTPSSAKAAIGDTVVFHFFPKNHSVVQGSFSAPCQPQAGGFFSGFNPSAASEANKTFIVTVKDTNPLWFYCSQGLHCKNGMAGVINPSYVLSTQLLSNQLLTE